MMLFNGHDACVHRCDVDGVSEFVADFESTFRSSFSIWRTEAEMLFLDAYVMKHITAHWRYFSFVDSIDCNIATDIAVA